MRGGTNALTEKTNGDKSIVPPIRFCLVCEQPFLRTNSHVKTCRECKTPTGNPNSSRSKPPKLCPICYSTFRPKHGLVRYCSKDCKAEAHRLLHHPPRPCPKCGEETDNRNGSSCSECRRQARRAEKKRREHRKRGAATEPYVLSEIAIRDNRKCGLCGKRVAMTKKTPHPRAPTIDHIIPVARGGSDTKANVQLAHFICNSRKSDRGQQQLRLVG